MLVIENGNKKKKVHYNLLFKCNNFQIKNKNITPKSKTSKIQIKSQSHTNFNSEFSNEDEDNVIAVERNRDDLLFFPPWQDVCYENKKHVNNSTLRSKKDSPTPVLLRSTTTNYPAKISAYNELGKCPSLESSSIV